MKSHAEGFAHEEQLTSQDGTPIEMPRVAPRNGSPRAPKTMRVTFSLPISLLNRMRNAVYWTPGVTLTGLIKDALQDALDAREQRQGRAFPVRLSELKCGRPRKRSPSTVPSELREPPRVMHIREASQTGTVSAQI